VRFLGIGETNDLGDMYLRLKDDGHEVRVFMSYEDSAGVMEGMLDFTDDWQRELAWIREAGDDGVILFETASDGATQDSLRRDGFNVIGGSGLGDRLEHERDFGQQVLSDFLFDAPFAVAGGSQLADGAGQIMRLGHNSTLRLLSTTGRATAVDAPETGSPLGMDSTADSSAPGAPFVDEY